MTYQARPGRNISSSVMTGRCSDSSAASVWSSGVSSAGLSSSAASALFFLLATFTNLFQKRVIDEPAEADVDAAEGGAYSGGDD